MEKLSFKDDPRIPIEHRKKLREFCSSLGEDLIGLVNDIGLKVFEEDLWPYEAGYLEYAPTCGSPSNYRIVVNARHSVARKRFTVAHELAHFILHRDTEALNFYSETRHRSDLEGSQYFDYLGSSDRKLEVEANNFAGNLLMPANLLRPAFSRLGGDRDQLAKLFEVSKQALELRIQKLKLE